jgi:thiosulfate dehydrogenase (quinone) large subunit
MIALQRTNHDPRLASAPDARRLPRSPGELWARYGPPPRATRLTGWAILPLRLFLGGTFTFAGLQKLANPGFFDASNPTSIQAQMASAARVSPIHVLVAHLQHVAVLIGVLISLGELAVGVATLVGLWSRVAAGGGMLLSFSLFLTVSFHSSPYYTGSDIVFLFAWVPLLIAGAGGVLSVDAVLADVARQELGAGSSTVVALPFDVVQQVCGVYDHGSCRAQAGAPCGPMACPYLQGRFRSRPAVDPDQIDRRTFSLRAMAAAGLAALGLLLAGLTAALGRAAGGTKSSSSPQLGGSKSISGAASSSTSAPGKSTSGTASQSTGSSTSQAPGATVAAPSGQAIGAASAVPVGGSASFTDPSSGDPSLVVQPDAGTFVAFDAVCPHEGCIVAYSSSARRFICPCHGSQFNGRTGAVLQGPAPHGLTRIKIQEGSNGQLYVT